MAKKSNPAPAGKGKSGKPEDMTDAEWKAKAEAAKAEAAAKRKAEAEAAKAKAEAALAPIAREINTRMEKATQLDGKADDHRLAAAIKLAEAKTRCSESGLSFTEWAKANVKITSEAEIRRLVKIGASPDPQLALADMRAGNAERNKKSRAKAKAGKAGSAGRIEGPREKPQTPFELVDQNIRRLDDKSALSVAESRLTRMGMAVISKTDADFARKAIVEAEKPEIERAKALFEQMTAANKMEFLQWACGQIGAKLDLGQFATVTENVAEDPLAIPAGLKRQPTRRAAAAA